MSRTVDVPRVHVNGWNRERSGNVGELVARVTPTTERESALSDRCGRAVNSPAARRGVLFAADPAEHGFLVDEPHRVRAGAGLFGGHGEGDRVGSAGLEEARRDDELALRPDVVDVWACVPSVDEDLGPVRRRSRGGVLDAQPHLGVGAAGRSRSTAVRYHRTPGRSLLSNQVVRQEDSVRLADAAQAPAVRATVV